MGLAAREYSLNYKSAHPKNYFLSNSSTSNLYTYNRRNRASPLLDYVHHFLIPFSKRSLWIDLFFRFYSYLSFLKIKNKSHVTRKVDRPYLSTQHTYLFRFLIVLLLISISTLISCDEKNPEKIQKPNQKISSSLSKVLATLETPQKNSGKQLIPSARVDKEGRVQVYVKLNEFNQENLNLLKAHGLKLDIYDEKQKLVQGWALPKNIKIISEFDFVKMIDLPSYGYTR